MTPEQTLLVEENTGLVHYLIKKYFPKAPIEYDDLVQEGMIGLMKAAEHYEPGRVKFSSFAATVIRNEICMAVRKTYRKSVIPNYAKIPIDAPIHTDDDMTFADVIADPDSDFTAQPDEAADIETARQMIDTLPPLDRRVMELKVYGGYKQEEIGRIVGSSQSYVARIMQRAEKQLRALTLEEKTPERKIIMQGYRLELNYDVDIAAVYASCSRTNRYNELITSFDKAKKIGAKLEGAYSKNVKSSILRALKTYNAKNGVDIRCFSRDGVTYLVRGEALP